MLAVLAGRWSRRVAPSMHSRPLGAHATARVALARAGSQPTTHLSTAAWKPHYDYRRVAEDVGGAQRNVELRKARGDAVRVKALYEQSVALSRRADELRRERNELSAASGTDARERGRALKQSLAVLERELAEVRTQLEQEAARLPNDSDPRAPVGPESAAVTVATVGEALGLCDFAAAARVSGARFAYMTGDGALLELALVSFAMSRLVARASPWTPALPPDLVLSSVAEGCGFQPRGDESQVFSVEQSPLVLIGTSEIPLTGAFANQLLPEAALPLRRAGFSHCFRLQVEMVALCRPDESEALLREMVAVQTEIVEALGLHARVLDMPTEELGASAYRKVGRATLASPQFDVEAWMPGRGGFGEVCSASNCTDYQSRRLNIRYKSATGENRFVHTLNATALAVPRVMIALLETHQQPDGSVRVPQPLRPFMFGRDVLRPPK